MNVEQWRDSFSIKLEAVLQDIMIVEFLELIVHFV